MMISKRKYLYIAIFLSIFMLLFGSQPAYSYASSAEADSLARDDFEIQYFFGPDATQLASDKDLAKRIADAGFTVAFLQTGYQEINGMAGLWGYADPDGAKSLETALKSLEEQDIKVYLKMGTISSDLTIAGIWTDLSHQLVSGYLDGSYDNVIGIDLGDEPKMELAGNYANALSTLHAAFPNMEAYYNLFPSHAVDVLVGTDDGYDFLSEEQYEGYLRSFLINKT